MDIDVNSVKKYTICEKITEKSTMEDFMEVLGNPSTIEYSLDDDQVKLLFNEKLTNWYSSIRVLFDGEGETISSIKYEYSYLDF